MSRVNDDDITIKQGGYHRGHRALRRAQGLEPVETAPTQRKQEATRCCTHFMRHADSEGQPIAKLGQTHLADPVGDRIAKCEFDAAHVDVSYRAYVLL
jgi:hypothetical protein